MLLNVMKKGSGWHEGTQNKFCSLFKSEGDYCQVFYVSSVLLFRCKFHWNMQHEGTLEHENHYTPGSKYPSYKVTWPRTTKWLRRQKENSGNRIVKCCSQSTRWIPQAPVVRFTSTNQAPPSVAIYTWATSLNSLESVEGQGCSEAAIHLIWSI